MRTILITGGAGFIGTNFVRYLLKADPAVAIVNIDALTYAGSLSNLEDLSDPSRHIFVNGNICDQELIETILREHHIQTIVHFAAESHVDRSIANPRCFMETNAMGTLSLLEAARNIWMVEKIQPSHGEVRFHHVSTDEVYGALGPNDTAFTEHTPYAPNSPYAVSKAASDHLVRAYGHTYGLPISITNCSNNYGPYQFPEKLIPLIILNALNGRSLPIYGDGQQIRDWLYVDDHNAAIWEVVNRGLPGTTYNVGGENQLTNLALVQEICSILDDHFPESPYTPHAQLIQFVPDRPGHDWRYAMDITKITQDLNWRPKETLTSGLRKTVMWYLSHSEWVTAISNNHSYQQWLDNNYRRRV